MKADNLRKRERLYNEAIKKAEEQVKKGFPEGAAFNYLKAKKLLSEKESPKEITTCLYNVGICYIHVKKYDLAEQYLQSALKVFEHIENGDNSRIASILTALGNVYEGKENLDKAESCCKKALAISEKVFGEDDSLTVGILNNLGNIYRDKGDFNTASIYYQRAGKTIEKSPLKVNETVKELVSNNIIVLQKQVDDLEREKLELKAALHQADRLSYLGRMATMMAHNIKNPVNNITTATVSMLMGIKNKGITAEQLIPSLERILNNSDRLNKIIENFRNFAQGDRTTFSNINLNETIEDIFQLLFVGQYQNHQIELIKAFAEFPVIAKTNSFAMQEVLITLLNNAKEVLINKEFKKVKVITWQNNGKVGFDIEDNGGGIAEEKRDKLFSPFFSSKNDGMGLGLYFCKEILKDLDGNIEYYPAPHGAGFRVSLPIGTELENGTQTI